jgi:lysyl-tRNA synthetase class 2
MRAKAKFLDWYNKITPPRQVSYTTNTLPLNARVICLRGRITLYQDECYALDDGFGSIRFRWHERLNLGGIVEVYGAMEDGLFLAETVVVLVDSSAEGLHESSDWGRFQANSRLKRRNLEIRAQVLKAIRDFFAERDFLEVETPSLNQGCGQEANIQLFRTAYQTQAQKTYPCWLMPSPEHYMKRLLGSGFNLIYQMGRAFRNGERTAYHNPEFTMLEWYRAYQSYDCIMKDLEDLVAYVVYRIKGEYSFTYQGQTLGLQHAWKRITVSEAMADLAGIDLDRCVDQASFFQEALAQGYVSIGPQDTWEDLFYKVFLEQVEPALKSMGPVLLLDYPARMASLARLKVEDRRWAERVEGYIGGLELANGYSELNDPMEQRQRFVEERKRRVALGGEGLPLDEGFLKMMEEGMPPATGMALGVDRLVMLCTDADCIDDSMAFPFNPEQA